MSTRDEIRDMILANAGSPTDKNIVVVNGITIALAKAQIQGRHLFLEARDEEEVDLNEDDYFITLPTTCQKVASVILVDGSSSYPLELKTKSFVLRKIPSVEDSTSSKPMWCYEFGRRLYVAPKSNADYVLRIGFIKFLTFVDGSSSCPISGLESYLVEAGTAFLFRSMQMHEEALRWEQMAQYSLNQMMEFDRNSQDKIKKEMFSINGPVQIDDDSNRVIPAYLDPFAKE